MQGIREVITQALLFAVAARAVTLTRPSMVARPRRGSADLGDRDPTPRGRPEPRAIHRLTAVEREPWLAGAAWTALALTVGFAVRGAMALV